MLGQTCSIVFTQYRNFFETTTTNICMFLLQFCNDNGFAATSDVIMLFCPLLDNWILCRIGVVRQETWSYSTWFVKFSSMFSTSDVLRCDSTVVIDVLINISSLKVKQPIICKFRSVECRPVTSLGHQEGRRVFWGPKIFELCPIFLNYIQHIFPGGKEKFWGDLPPLVTGLIECMNMRRLG